MKHSVSPFMAALCGAVALTTPAPVYAQNPAATSCTFWHAADIIDVGDAIEIKVIGVLTDHRAIPGMAPDGSFGRLDFHRLPLPGSRPEAAYVAFIEPQILGPGTFVGAAGRSALFIQEELGQFGMKTPQYSNVSSGAIPSVPLTSFVLNPPLRCTRQADLAYLVDVGAGGPKVKGLDARAPTRVPVATNVATLPVALIPPIPVGPTEIDPRKPREGLGPEVDPPALSSGSDTGAVESKPSIRETLGTLPSYSGSSKSPNQIRTLRSAFEPALAEEETTAAVKLAGTRKHADVREADAEHIASTSTLSKADNVPEASAKEHEIAPRICAALTDSPVSVVGMRNQAELVNTYVFDPVAGDPLLHPWRLDLSDSKGLMLALALLARGRAMPAQDETGAVLLSDTGAHIQVLPARFSGIESVPIVMPDGTRAETGPYVMRLMVVGDAPSVAIAGLSEAEQELREVRTGYTWRVTWHETLADGTLADGVDYPTLAKLESAAQLRADADKAILSLPDKFERFTHQLAARITASESLIDYVLWIQEGYPLPNNAPLLVENLLRDVAERGSVPRFPNGNPEKWLTVINGQILGNTKAYLDNPLKYANPTPQSLLEEEITREPRRLLTRVAPLVNSLRLVGERSTSDKAANSLPLADESMVIDANQAFESVGLMLTAEGIEKLSASARAAYRALESNAWKADRAFEGLEAAYDLGSLISIKSSPDGVPEGLVFDPATSQFLEKRVDDSAMGPSLIASFAVMQNSLPAILKGMTEHNCDYVYLTSRELELDWQRVE